MDERWRYIGQGDLGHIWHDTVHNRYVISDEHGPEGIIARTKRGAHLASYTKQFNQDKSCALAAEA